MLNKRETELDEYCNLNIHEPMDFRRFQYPVLNFLVLLSSRALHSYGPLLVIKKGVCA